MEILNQNSMEQAKELARNLTRIEKEKEADREKQEFKRISNKVSEAWKTVRDCIKQIFKRIKGVIDSVKNITDRLEKQTKLRNSWITPFKIEPTKQPDVFKNHRVPNIRNKI